MKCRKCSSENVSSIGNKQPSMLYGNEIAYFNSYKCDDCGYEWTESTSVTENNTGVSSILLG